MPIEPYVLFVDTCASCDPVVLWAINMGMTLNRGRDVVFNFEDPMSEEVTVDHVMVCGLALHLAKFDTCKSTIG